MGELFHILSQKIFEKYLKKNYCQPITSAKKTTFPLFRPETSTQLPQLQMKSSKCLKSNNQRLDSR